MLPKYPGEPPRDLSRPLGHIKILVDLRLAGLRLDVALATVLTWRSRTSSRQLIDDGLVRVEGRPARASRKLEQGETITVALPARAEPSADLEATFDHPILYEDAWMIAIDKPPGLAVHPAGRRVKGTLISALHARYRRPDDPAHDVVPRLLHRIDVETSGVVAVGLNEDFHHQVARQFEDRKVHKTYLAVVHGRPAGDAGTVDLPIGKATGTEVRLKLEGKRDGSGLPAVTDWSFLRGNGRYSLLELRPRTGRTHQIRVHMASLGCPLVGDKLYGVGDEVFFQNLKGQLSEQVRAQLVLERHALHAHRLVFFHPMRGAELTLEAPLPADMAALVDAAT